MQSMRRLFLKASGRGGALAAALAAGLLHPQQLLAAWNKDAFAARTPADALKNIGASGAAESKDLLIDAPQIAENGGVVPIEVTSNIPGTRSIAVMVEKNPFPLVGRFAFKEGAVPFVKVNVKIGESSNVRVVAEAGGKYFSAMKEVKVTIGGCGG